MADVQKHFEKFHATIRTDYDMSSTLREKRDRILNRIRKYLLDNKLPGFDELLQGSYKMKTGVAPIADLEYDIDVGLRFSFKESDYTAEEVRGWVFNAVKDHTETVEEMGPCTRVTYSDGYHVDLVSYAWWTDFFGNEQFRLAHKKNGWRPADPPKLLDYVNTAREPYAGTEDSATKTDQFRRCVRYLRRWNDVAIPREEEGKATGLAFVLLCVERLRPQLTLSGTSDDRRALENLASGVAGLLFRVVAKKPTPEYEDMFGRMSDSQMQDFKTRMGTLRDALKKADAEPDPVKACEALRKVFGEDFPVPSPEETGTKTRSPAILTSSASA